MTVYFIAKVDDPETVKIGSTEDLDRRLTNLATFHGPIELLAQCDGSKDAEHSFHQIFKESWIEGEWYSRSPLLDGVISKLASRVPGRRVWGRLRAIESMGLSPVDQDKVVARDLLKQIMDHFGADTFGSLITSSYEVLSSINPAWTHRRVRAIWNSETSRIDHFEVRDMQVAIQRLRASEAA